METVLLLVKNNGSRRGGDILAGSEREGKTGVSR